MIDRLSVGSKLKDLEFTSFSKIVYTILSAFCIEQSTIAKITEKIDKGEEGPFYVYRRAIIFCSEDDNYQSKLSTVNGAVPLIIIFQPDIIYICNSTKGTILCEYGNLANHIEYLEPLQSIEINRADQYSTLALDTVVESLYRALKIADNKEEDIRTFIFTLLYMAHFSSMIDDHDIISIIKDIYIHDDKKLDAIFSKYSVFPFIYKCDSNLSITKEAYKYIFAIIKFDTNNIDAEILTSLVYRMVEREESGLYGHQTSFVNVRKLICPLFLDDLNKKSLCIETENEASAFLEEISQIVVFDPTNSPGSYLVAVYNGLLQIIEDITIRFQINCIQPLNISNFVGLTENKLTYELSRLAITFTHTKVLKNMGVLSLEKIKETHNALSIFYGDELNTDWTSLVTPTDNLYIVGSPKFKGDHKLSQDKKVSMQKVFNSIPLYNADYCSAWLVKAAQTIKGTRAKAAFVLTNSVSQGSQSSFIQDKVIENGCEYIFAHRPFKWITSSLDNVAVTVVIIGIAPIGVVSEKVVFLDNRRIRCNIISSALLPDINLKIKSRTTPLSKILPPMRKGNMPDGATALTFTSKELDDFLEHYPEAKKFIRPLYGGDELVNSNPKWCLWISDNDLAEAISIEGIAQRINIVKEVRNKKGSTASKKSRNNPHKFRETNCTSKNKISIAVPCVTSENRKYLQIGILDSNAIPNNNVSVIFNCDIWLLALLESRMHLVWVLNVAGKHESRPRYSSNICYNTFPLPQLGKKEIDELRNLSITLLEVREKYCDRSLAKMYDKMPKELERVHIWIDNTVDSYYRSQPFDNDSERLVLLNELYNKMIENE